MAAKSEMQALTEATTTEHAWLDLPLHERLVNRLVDLLILTDELRVSLHTEDANAILWLEPHVDRILGEIDAAMERLVT